MTPLRAAIVWPISFTAIFKSRRAAASPSPASSRAASIVQTKARFGREVAAPDPECPLVLLSGELKRIVHRLAVQPLNVAAFLACEQDVAEAITQSLRPVASLSGHREIGFGDTF